MVELFVLVLREVVGFDIMAQKERTFRERLTTRQQLDERRLASSIHTHQRDPVPALNREAHIAENVLLPVALNNVRSLGDCAPAWLRLWKCEVDCLLFGRDLNPFDLL